jgi:NAD(P)-dependent dehydrogenase (short-subunit alcohol dehydrogenase family)
MRLARHGAPGAEQPLAAGADGVWHDLRPVLPDLRPDTLATASKGAVLSLTLAMAADLLPDGIRVDAVNPGTADTPWVGRLLDGAADPQAERAALAARQPPGRRVTAEEVAAAIGYLASPAASSTTGTALAVDGGMQGLRPPPAGMTPDREAKPCASTPTTTPGTRRRRRRTGRRASRPRTGLRPWLGAAA